MKGLSVFLEDLFEEASSVETCRHCGRQIAPCTCQCATHGVHWQDAQASPGQGSLHCLGMPHQLHEPADA